MADGKRDGNNVPVAMGEANNVARTPMPFLIDPATGRVLVDVTGDGAAPAGQFSLSAAGGWPSTTNGCSLNTKVEFGTNDVDVWLLDFDQTSQEYAQWEIAMPSDWDGGTITATFYWLANDTTNNGVRWGLQGRSLGDGEAIDQAWGTAREVTDNNASTANQLRISAATSAITLAGTPAAGELVQLRAYRDPTNVADTLAADARLRNIVINFNRG